MSLCPQHVDSTLASPAQLLELLCPLNPDHALFWHLQGLPPLPRMSVLSSSISQLQLDFNDKSDLLPSAYLPTICTQAPKERLLLKTVAPVVCTDLFNT